MVRTNNRSRRGRVSKGRGGGRRSQRKPTAEQLDFEMELLKAKNEGREAEFRKEKALERQAAKKKNLDDDMDEYFKNRQQKDKDAEAKDDTAEQEQANDEDPNQNSSSAVAASSLNAPESNK